jgi:hypothetical protein
MPQLFKSIDFIRDGRPFLQDWFGVFRIVPESLFGDNAFDFRQSFFIAVDVKESSVSVLISTLIHPCSVLIQVSFCFPPLKGFSRLARWPVSRLAG